MNSLTDQQLLRNYAASRSEPAFAELVRRHVDLVYSAALRMVCDSHLAEDVTQGAFVALARNAGQLAAHPVLSGWLHRTAQNIAAQTVRTDVRRRSREHEAALMNELLSPESDAPWESIAPQLDAALGDLNEADRDALLLRYFERKSAREMAQTLGVSDEAAQKRVSRAVDRLRELLVKRGVPAGAAGLAVTLSANAVHAAPAGLVAAISSTAALSGTVTTTAATIATATKTIAMTTLQKTLVTVTIAAAVGAGIYQSHQASAARAEMESLKQQQAPLAGQIQQLQGERDDASNQLSAVLAENARLKSGGYTSELLKLRNEVQQLRSSQRQLAQVKNDGPDTNDPLIQRLLDLRARIAQMTRYLDQMPDKNIPETKILTDEDWMHASIAAKYDTDADVRKTLSKLRSLAKDRLPMGSSLYSYVNANQGQLPTDLSQLKPYVKSALGDLAPDDSTIDSIFSRYTLLHTGNASDYPQGTWFITEKAPVDSDYDSRVKFGIGSSSSMATGKGELGDPDDPSY